MFARTHRRAGRSVARLLATSAGVAAAVASMIPTPGLAAAYDAPADDALAWQSGQLAANGGTMPGFTAGSVDWGLTADAVLAYVAAGRADDPAATAATDALVTNLAAFTTWAPTMPEVRVAGATAKALLIVESMGRPSTVGGIDLEAEMRDLMRTDGPQAGRFSDRVPEPTWDAANGFGQALAILALATTHAGVPTPAVTFLLAQQCPSGGFRLSYPTAACESDDEADTDATALAVQALLPVDRTAGVAGALERAVAWLLARQNPLDGSFGGTGPTAAANSNSTGLVAQALRAAGQVAPADRAAHWIVSSTQLTVAEIAGTPAAEAVGAIAYNPAARNAALANGVTAQTADQWRRATAQAVLALGLAAFGPAGSAPVTPATTAPSTTVSSTTAPSTTTPSTTTPATTAPSTTVSSTTVLSTALPSTGAAVSTPGLGDDANVLSATAGPSGAALPGAPVSSLATTGSASAPMVWFGVAAVLLGASATLAAADRRRA